MRDMYNNRRPILSERPNNRMQAPKKPNNDKDDSMEKHEIRLATAYIPNQPYVGLVPLQEGFHRGSMFPNLYQPYQDWRRR
ncbi:hypothetical protein SH1V18_24090 [Vallitalea longa]|uniref:Spore coat associated protein JA (CotJA) n=1 Tax=Vallitalea longa TaxID=2936439 RepID=A0A9W6DGM8_9FIRM|nr:spore coat associated protein CotJA [Vallitalea longa]GKX29929.1 hypothetical protein SH1V18_24090 [Vallitalea longa]